MASGKPGEAAQLFARLAAVLGDSNHPRQAANMHAKAAHAFADSQAEQAALTHARSALKLFIQYRMDQRTPVFYANILRKFTNRGMQTAASHLQQEYGSQIQGTQPALTPARSPKRPSLPTNCPKCGAPLRGDKAGWVDANTVQCEYCGALVRASG